MHFLERGGSPGFCSRLMEELRFVVQPTASATIHIAHAQDCSEGFGWGALPWLACQARLFAFGDIFAASSHGLIHRAAPFKQISRFANAETCRQDCNLARAFSQVCAQL